METTMADIELEDKMVNDEFQSLIDAYLASKHRKKVDIITKAFIYCFGINPH
jgi:GTP pyrophosphokinase